MFNDLLAMGAGGGEKISAYGILENITANTEYEIDTGLSEVHAFSMMGNDYSRYGTVLCYNSDFSTAYVAQGGGNAPVSSATIPSANTNYFIGFISIVGGIVTIKTPQNTAFVSTLYWSAS